MRYFLTANLTALRRNLTTYLPTAGFLAAGMAVLFFALSGMFSFFDDLNDRLRNVEGTDLTVSDAWNSDKKGLSQNDFGFYFPYKSGMPSKKGQIIPDEDAFVMPLDFERVTELYGDKVRMKASTWRSFRTEYNGEEYEFTIAYVSDDYFRPFRGQMDGDFIIGPRRILDFIAAASTPGSEVCGKLRQFPLLYDTARSVFTDLDGEGVIRQLFTEDVKNLGSFDTKSFVHESAVGEDREVDINSYVFIPMKYYFDVYWPGDSITLRLNAKDWNDLYGVLAVLNQNHKGHVVYTFSETVSMFLGAVREQSRMVEVALPATLLVLVVVGMNFMGLQMRSVARRRRDFAIQMAYGAGKGHIMGGAFFLAMLTVTAAAVAAIILGALAVRAADIRLFNVFVTVKWKAAFVILGYAWLLGTLSCLPTQYRLSKATPVSVLAEL